MTFSCSWISVTSLIVSPIVGENQTEKKNEKPNWSVNGEKSVQKLPPYIKSKELGDKEGYSQEGINREVRH
jgi:hypothetical protein